MERINLDHCREFIDFCVDCSMTAGVDVMEEILDALWNKKTPHERVYIMSTTSLGPETPGGIYTGYIMIGDKEYRFEYESTNIRGCVILEWEQMEDDDEED